MLINLSNHPSNLWSEKQMKIAIQEFSSVKDISFPFIEPDWDEKQIQDLAEQFFKLIFAESNSCVDNFAVHIMGEFNFVFALTNLLLKNGINCVASTTKREVTYDSKGNKVSDFNFIQFRKYIMQ